MIRIGSDVAGFPTSCGIKPVAGRKQLVAGVARNASRSCVLLGATNIVGYIWRRSDMVKLCGRIVLGRPCRSTVDRDGGAAVVGDDHARGIIGRNPQVVMVGMRIMDLHQRSAAVAGAIQIYVHGIDYVWV